MQIQPLSQQSPTNVDAAAESPSTVTLIVPARHDQLPLVRLLTEAAAMRNNCTLDQAADLKLAIDQICTLLITAAAPDTEITCRYQVVGDTFEATLTAVTVADWHPEPGSLEWRMLSALADSLSTTQHPTATGKTNESVVTVGTRKLV